MPETFSERYAALLKNDVFTIQARENVSQATKKNKKFLLSHMTNERTIQTKRQSCSIYNSIAPFHSLN